LHGSTAGKTLEPELAHAGEEGSAPGAAGEAAGEIITLKEMGAGTSAST